MANIAFICHRALQKKVLQMFKGEWHLFDLGECLVYCHYFIIAQNTGRTAGSSLQFSLKVTKCYFIFGKD